MRIALGGHEEKWLAVFQELLFFQSRHPDYFTSVLAFVFIVAKNRVLSCPH